MSHNMSDLKKLAFKLSDEGPVQTMATPRRVQVLFGGQWLVRTTNALYVWENAYYPWFYVPRQDLVAGAKAGGFELKEVEQIQSAHGKTIATQYSISHAGSGKATDRILAFSADLDGKAGPLRDLVRIQFDAVDEWFEEDVAIYQHPKDPYKRIDIIQSQRRIRVTVAGKVIADASTGMHLFETGLQRRFYLPPTAFDLSLLRPSSTRTLCPYKGEAEYYDVVIDGEVHKDLVWYYRSPVPESAAIKGLLCPYNERMDIELDGEKLERPAGRK